MAVTRAKLARAFVELSTKHPLKKVIAVLAEEIIAGKLTNQVDLLVSDIGRELLRQQGTLSAEVVTARELSTAIRTQIAELLKRETGAQRVSLSELRDGSIKGGIVARTADLELDLSIIGKLKQLETQNG